MKQNAKKPSPQKPSLSLQNERRLKRLSERIEEMRQLLKMID